MAKPIWSSDRIAAQLDSGVHWSGSSLTYSFATGASWVAGGEAAGFSQLNAAQQAAATSAMALWDSLIAPNFTLAAGNAGDIKFANTTTNISYAHAYMPGSSGMAGSIWFNSNYGASSGTNNLVDPQSGAWGNQTFIHEIGHALGLDHPGNYNGGSPTYAKHALFKQDSEQYTLMSYFGADKTGADWVASDGIRYHAQTPMLYDILALQKMYGADTTTRAGDTTYGYNADAGVAVYDFDLNPHPILCLYDAGGTDTLDLSGSSYACMLDLTPGSFSNSDMMTSNISIAFGAWIENAVGSAQNDTLKGSTIDNALSGLAGDDTLAGGAGSDTLNGGNGNDRLDGGTGADILVGGSGDDIYVVDDAGDIVTEAANGGWDTVQSMAREYTLAANAEALTYIGRTNFTGYGNSDDNVLTGGAASDKLYGGAGADHLVGGTGNGCDLLDGGTGADVMVGGGGNDTYVVDSASDVITEAFRGGIDTVQVSLSTFVLTSEFEHLSYVGSGNFDGTGNAFGNTLKGGDLNDTLRGLTGNDILQGYAGDDVLDGGLGKDKMYGGAGNDTYVVDVSSDSITETANAGIDTVLTTLRVFTLGAHFENLTYTGAMTFKGTGNAFANAITGGSGNDTLIGNAGADVLDGGAGNDILLGGIGSDTLTGSAGADIFRFGALNESNTFAFDTITDFNAAEFDKVDLAKLDANTRVGGNQAFTFIGAASFTASAGQLSFDAGLLSADVTGDGLADFGIYLTGVSSLTASEFFL
jgi:serralysin